MNKSYFYRFMNGKLIIKEGHITGHRWRSPREMIFQYGKRAHEWIACHPESGEMMRGGLWLPERDDDKARKLLIEYYESRIADMDKQIASYREKIEALRGAKGEIE